MRLLPSSCLAIAALIAFFAGSIKAEVMLDPTAVSTNMGTGIGTINHVIDQSGLSMPYTSGVTDFASYTSTTTSTATGGVTWVSNTTSTTGNVIFTLSGGSEVTIDSFALWTGNGVVTNGQRSIQDFTLLASDDPTFATFATLGPFTAAEPPATATVTAQVFDFTATTASYVELQIMSNYGASVTSFGEAAFAEILPPSVPEPSSLAMCGVAGAVGLVVARMRRNRHAA